MFHSFSVTLKIGQFRYTGRYKNLIACFIFTLNKSTNIRSLKKLCRLPRQRYNDDLRFFNSVTHTALHKRVL